MTRLMADKKNTGKNNGRVGILGVLMMVGWRPWPPSMLIRAQGFIAAGAS